MGWHWRRLRDQRNTRAKSDYPIGRYVIHISHNQVTKAWLILFADIIETYKERAPRAQTLFNYSPDTALWAIQRRFPLAGNCTTSPGKDLVGHVERFER
jgi:hypothetical protein